jgi:hypothetical protein
MRVCQFRHFGTFEARQIILPQSERNCSIIFSDEAGPVKPRLFTARGTSPAANKQGSLENESGQFAVTLTAEEKIWPFTSQHFTTIW